MAALRHAVLQRGPIATIIRGGVVAEWVRGLERWLGLTVSRPGSNPAAATSLRNFGNSVYPALPVSFGEDSKAVGPLASIWWCLYQIAKSK